MNVVQVFNRITISIAVSLYLCVALSSNVFAGTGRLNVLTTTPDLKSIVEFVGGDRVKADSLSRGSQDPHFVEAKPSYMIKARKADLFIRIGMDLEVGYESLILNGARNPGIQIGQPGHLDMSTGITPLEVPTGDINRSLGDVHPQGNPHYWLDPLNAVTMANRVAERLAQLSPEDGRFFENNARVFERKIYNHLFGNELVDKVGGKVLADLLREDRLEAFLKEKGLGAILGGWIKEMAPFNGRKIVTYHKSWLYFAHRFGLVIANELEAKPGISPGPRHINRLIKQIPDEGIAAILMEPFYDDKPALLVAKKTGAKVVKAANSVGGSKKAKDYFGLIDSIVRELAKVLAP